MPHHRIPLQMERLHQGPGSGNRALDPSLGKKRPQCIYTPCPLGGLRLSASPPPHPGKAHAVAFVPDVAGTQRKAWLCTVLPSPGTQT